MPITPVHMGPALAVKAVAPKRFSLLVFGVTQVIIDSEAAFHIVRGDWPIHDFLHTYLGATLVAALTVAVARLDGYGYAIRLWKRVVARTSGSLFRIEPRIPLSAAVSGALIGGYSHVLLDSVLYSDMRPFAPLSESNALLGVMSASQVYLLCLALGALGAVALTATHMLGRRSVS